MQEKIRHSVECLFLWNRRDGIIMKINVHAGHNPDGKVSCGAIGLIKESTEARKVKDEVIKLLKEEGHTVYDCTCSDGTSQSDVLNKIIKKCNEHVVDVDVSIHFNAGATDKIGNGRTTGTEVLLYSSESKAKEIAEKVVRSIAQLGFKNRGIKYRTDLAVLRRTKSPALLVECCFVDDKDDVNLYSAKTMAKAIVEGIFNKKVEESIKDDIYRVQVGAFQEKTVAEVLAKKVKAAGFECYVTK